MQYLEEPIGVKEPEEQKARKTSRRGKKTIDEKYINLDVFLRLCIIEFSSARVRQLEHFIYALKVTEFHNYCDLLYNDFESAVKCTYPSFTQRWIDNT